MQNERRSLIGATRVLILGLLGVIAAAPVAAAAAPTPAEQALADGIKAYQAEQFDKARDLLIKAASVPKPSGDAFVWLGKTYLQLGQVTEAIGAFGKARRLMPGDPYAARMLKALRGETIDAEAQLALVRSLLDNGMASDARTRCARLLASSEDVRRWWEED